MLSTARNNAYIKLSVRFEHKKLIHFVSKLQLFLAVVEMMTYVNYNKKQLKLRKKRKNRLN